MKINTKLFLFGFILLFILIPNNVFAQVTDTDGDGIPDSSDSCPTQAETFNGVEDSDGCPDVATLQDSDKDGIINSADVCPRSP